MKSGFNWTFFLQIRNEAINVGPKLKLADESEPIAQYQRGLRCTYLWLCSNQHISKSNHKF